MQNMDLIAKLIKTLNANEPDALNDIEVGPNLTAYDLLENLATIHYELSTNTKLPDDFDLDQYLQSL